VGNSPRQFTDSPAVRTQVPLWTALTGQSGSGKTFSAFRLATGMQRVYGGDIFGIDTESNRMLHYAERFKFRHIPFKAPFGSLDYLAAIEYARSKGGKVIVIDSMSHEHVGEGGCLEVHEAECQRLMDLWKQSYGKVTFAAWAKPKAARTKLINTLLQMGDCCFVFCFRAKEKIKIVKGQDPIELGMMPLAGEELVYEMMSSGLLMPGCDGVPIWDGIEKGEKQVIKCPRQFREYFKDRNKGKQLDEAAGEFMARWAMGDVSTPEEKANKEAFDALIQEAYGVTSLEGLESIRKRAGKNKGVKKPKMDEMKEIIAKKTAELTERQPGDEG